MEFRVEGFSVSPFDGDPTDAVLDVLDDSGAIDAVASASEPLGFVSVMFTLDADTLADATRRGEELIRAAFAHARLAEPSGLTVQDQPTSEILDLLQAEVSAAQIAEASGLSRERIRQLSEASSFPMPVRKLGRSLLWRAQDVIAFFASRGTDPREIIARLRTTSGQIAEDV